MTSLRCQTLPGMAEPPATAQSVPIIDSTRECVDLSEGAATALMLPAADTMIELRAHEEPELQVWAPAVELDCHLAGVSCKIVICACCEVLQYDEA